MNLCDVICMETYGFRGKKRQHEAALLKGKGKGKGKWCVAKYGDPYLEFVLCI